MHDFKKHNGILSRVKQTHMLNIKVCMLNYINAMRLIYFIIFEIITGNLLYFHIFLSLCFAFIFSKKEWHNESTRI